ncbi:MAG: (Fe-S)-binding protein [Planctomycetota bacterium]|jgi:L-lactate dehydrogenase complex protein LldE|nr:(Fe-S)-binding protein [Planctomycetota bacterium]MDP6763433.1 (Fe-S)-binding protein [Planctomycetota bacterium]MDP6988595.1 (Fe-S)-binding protein [Planctomycetota bacterium]
MRVSLFVSCLVDQLWPAAGAATVAVLRKAGCAVEFDPRQTCCGQPAWNTGYTKDARALLKRTVALLEESDAEAVVVPSGSCTAMLRHAPTALGGEGSWSERAAAVAGRTHELSGFLVDVLGVEDLGARLERRVSWHDACHGLRELGLREQPRRLLKNVSGCELVEAPGCEECCGFGGTFSAKHPELSVAMSDEKIEAIEATGVDAVVSSDAGCLMQLRGRLEARGSSIEALHIAEVLASGRGA